MIMLKFCLINFFGIGYICMLLYVQTATQILIKYSIFKSKSQYTCIIKIDTFMTSNNLDFIKKSRKINQDDIR